MFVLGIDPGLTRCGYGVVERDAGGKLRGVAAGVMTSPKDDPLPQRLAALSRDLRALIAEFDPAAVVVEQVLFQTAVRTAMSVGQASGLALAAAAEHGCEVVQYTSNQVKQAVTGHGAADKAQVARMVQALLCLAEPPKPADAADALALAICHHTIARITNAAAATERARAGTGSSR